MSTDGRTDVGRRRSGHRVFVAAVATALAAALVPGCTTADADLSSPTSSVVNSPWSLPDTLATTAANTAAGTSPDTVPASAAATNPTEFVATTEPAPATEPPTTEPTTAPTTAPTTDATAATEPPLASVAAVPAFDPTPATTKEPLTNRAFGTLAAAFATLAEGNAATSITVWRDHEPAFASASGYGRVAVTPDSPMVLASVSKLITALTVARLIQRGEIDPTASVPWNVIGIPHDPAWDDVTVVELLAHTAGMPKARANWLNKPGTCRVPLTEAMATPPTVGRGTWVYSNGNYCALGLLVELVTGEGIDAAAQRLVFDPIGVTGPHLTTQGVLPDDAPYIEAGGVARLERLGGAGTWVASTDDITAMLDSVTTADRQTLIWPGVITDQYGWGHTGTVDGAKACTWVIEGGRTVVTAVVSGNKPSTGARVCDVVVPALAADLGIWAGDPVRTPD